MTNGGLDAGGDLPVSLKRCPRTGAVLAVAGSGCAKPLAGAIVAR
jgi:hypothetical protein